MQAFTVLFSERAAYDAERAARVADPPAKTAPPPGAGNFRGYGAADPTFRYGMYQVYENTTDFEWSSRIDADAIKCKTHPRIVKHN